MRLLGILLIVLVPTLALAAAPKKTVLVRFNYSEKGELVCEGEEQLESTDRYQLCEGEAGGRKVIVRVKAEPQKDGQILLQADIDHIDAFGKVTQLSRPKIMALDGETSAISVSEADDLVPNYSLEFTPSILNQ